MFFQHPFARPRFQFIDDLCLVRPAFQLGEARRFQVENPIFAAVFGVDVAGKNDGQVHVARDRQQFRGAVDRFLDVSAAERIGIVETIDKIDNQQRRFLAESDPVAETLLFVNCGVFGIMRIDGHGMSPRLGSEPVG